MIFQYNLMFSFSTSLVQMQVVTVSTAGSGYLAQQVEQYTLARNN